MEEYLRGNRRWELKNEKKEEKEQEKRFEEIMSERPPTQHIDPRCPIQQKRHPKKVAPGSSMYKLVDAKDREKIWKAAGDNDGSHIGCGGSQTL